jgi:hypothetical protein
MKTALLAAVTARLLSLEAAHAFQQIIIQNCIHHACDCHTFCSAWCCYEDGEDAEAKTDGKTWGRQVVEVYQRERSSM